MKTKVCQHCKEELPINQFWSIPANPDGKDKRCKECRNKLVKKNRRDNGIIDVSRVRFTNLEEDDFYEAYKLLERLGYNLESDKSIHEQFCDKYGFQITKRDKPHRPYKSWSQVKKNPQ